MKKYFTLSLIFFGLLVLGSDFALAQATISPKPYPSGCCITLTSQQVGTVLKAAEPICCVSFSVLWSEYLAGACLVEFDYKDAAGYHFRVIRGGGTGISIVISNL